MAFTQRAFIGFAILVTVAFTPNGGQTRDREYRAPAPSGATFYFIRPEGLIPYPGGPDIKIDGQVVGNLHVGTYLVVNRPPGPHRLGVQNALLDLGFETEVDARPGQSYFFAIGPASDFIGTQGLLSAFNGTIGTRLPGRGLASAWVFYGLDSDSGRAAIAKFKRR
jgi:hypothetical protein